MVILHDAIKTIENGVFAFFIKKNKNLFLFKKQKSSDLKIKKSRWAVFLKTGFSQPRLSFNPYCNFPCIARSGKIHVTIIWLGVRRTLRL